MAFETGYAANEFDLQQKLDAFITSNGWTKHARLGPSDVVYFSSGEDEYKDIYIRVAAGLTEEPTTYGKDQKDFGDGYTGYMNCFAYQWFPENGTDGYDGYGEAGKFGPLLYWINGGDEYDVFCEKFASRTGFTWVNYLPNQARPGEPNDWITYYYMAMRDSDGVFDGKRYYYFSCQYSSSSGDFARFDLAAEKCELLDQKMEGGTSENTCGMVYYVDPVSRKEYVWVYKEDRTGTIENKDGELDATTDVFKRWDVSTGVMQYGFSGPEWGGDRYSGGGEMIGGGKDYLYVMQGKSSRDWAKYHIPSDTWTVMSGAPFEHNHSPHDSWTWLDKGHSGFSYSRIYAIHEDSDILYYINIDENSGDPVGDWQSAGTLGRTTYTYGPTVFHNKRNRFFYWPGGNTTYGREIWWADFKETGDLTWTLSEQYYLPYSYPVLVYMQQRQNYCFGRG